MLRVIGPELRGTEVDDKGMRQYIFGELESLFVWDMFFLSAILDYFIKMFLSCELYSLSILVSR